MYSTCTVCFSIWICLFLINTSLTIDEDKSGNLDAAECDSLFRLLYHIDELTQELKKILKEIDSDGDGLLSFGAFVNPFVVLKK
jgi:Ca2+-binding EF-hand superfamily protein